MSVAAVELLCLRGPAERRSNLLAICKQIASYLAMTVNYAGASVSLVSK
jgi:hypothetical protein